MPRDLREKDDSATPLTVKQVFRASRIHSEAPWILDGRELGLVRCIGTVVAMDLRENYRLLKIEDGTTRSVTVHIFKRKESPFWDTFTMIIAEKQIQLNTYACITGWVHGGDKGYMNSLRAKNIVPIENPHQIFFHFFECVHASKICAELQSEKEKELEQASSEEPPTDAEERKVDKKKDIEEHKVEPTEPPEEDPFGESSDEEVEYADEQEPPDSSSEFDVVEAEESRYESEVEGGRTSDNEAEIDRTMTIETEKSVVKAKPHVQFAIPISESKSRDTDEEDEEGSMTHESHSIASTSRNEPSESTPTTMDSSSNQQSQSSSHPDLDPLSGLGSLHRALILHIQRRREEVQADDKEWKGLHISELVCVLKRKKKGIETSGISAIFEDLVEDGQIFTTVNRSYYDTS